MKTYIIRVFTYVVYLIVIFMLVYGLMSITGYSKVPLSSFSMVLETSSGKLMVIVIAVLSLLYPFFGFVKRTVAFNISSNRDIFISTMEAYGFVLVSDENGIMTFKSKSLVRKLTMFYDDKIEVFTNDNPITISGNRKAVTRIVYRLNTMNL